jgi:Cu/Ag efflux pump CusA
VLQVAQYRLIGCVVAALIGIFCLLQAAFRSWRLAALTFVTLPSALVGGLVAAFVTGGVISLGSLVGFLVIFGIAARNGITLISHYQRLEREEGVPFGPKLVMRGTMERVSPILMTALVTGVVLVPALLLGDIPGLEVVRPMAVVILGGVVTSTVLNLFVVPSLYLRLAVSSVPDLEPRPVMGVAQRGFIGNMSDIPIGGAGST